MEKPVFHIPQCDDALLLVNPRALFLLQQGGVVHCSFPFVTAGVNINAPRFKSRIVAAGWQLLKNSHHGAVVDYTPLESQFVCRGVEFEYLFNVVGCGKCELCLHSKRLDFVNRCKLESECYSTPPFFFTLTYNSRHVPANGQLRYYDVQCFFKRFRKLLTSLNLPTDFRYVVAGEYGSMRGRPHYHVIMWNNPLGATAFTPHLSERLCRLLWQCWRMDDWNVFSDARNFNVCGDGAAGYCAKYIGKSVPARWRGCKWIRPFIHMSVGDGGIGQPFLRQFKDYYYSSVSNVFRYLSRLDGQLHEITFGSYLKNYFHPSPSRLVPARAKFLYKDFSERVQRWLSYGVINYHDAFDMLESLRPFKSVVAHRLQPVANNSINNNLTFGKWLMDKELDFHCELVPYVGCDLQPSVISRYYDYIRKQLPVEDTRGNLAGKKAHIRQLAAIQLHKEVF